MVELRRPHCTSVRCTCVRIVDNAITLDLNKTKQTTQTIQQIVNIPEHIQNALSILNNGDTLQFYSDSLGLWLDYTYPKELTQSELIAALKISFNKNINLRKKLGNYATIR